MQGFDFYGLISRYRFPLLILLAGVTVMLFGTFIFKSNILSEMTKVEVLDSATVSQGTGEITVEISGAVERPGVYKVASGSRIEDLLIFGGGFSKDADRVWTEKYLNRAAKLADGQKLYIPLVNQQSQILSAKENSIYQSGSVDFSSDSGGLINVNSASLEKLDTLPGIGPVYGQSIIEHRPYSTIEELVSKGAIKQSVFEKIKNLIAVY